MYILSSKGKQLHVIFFTQPPYESNTIHPWGCCGSSASNVWPCKYTEAGLFTYAEGWAGLPVVSVIHLYTGDFVVPLELVSWVTLKGHWIPRLTTISTSTAIHRYAWVPAGCSYWACTERKGGRRGNGGGRRERNYKHLSRWITTVIKLIH